MAYDGTHFSGYQVQPERRTVQGVVEQALRKLHKGMEVKIVASGRTDSGVHARGQVIHFSSDLPIPVDRWPKALNAMLPDDVRICRAEQVADSFHARYDAHRKEYRYRLLTRQEPDIFRRFYTLHVQTPLDTERMQAAGRLLVGTHNFSSFCAADTAVKSKTRTIYRLDIAVHGDETEIRVIGNGFLYQMVRIIVGTLLDVGNCTFPPEQVAVILAAVDRQMASRTAPACGLTLWNVQYN